MPTNLDIRLEIHTPGLDLWHHRINYHKMFMEAVHNNIEWISAQGYHQYQQRGRGVLFVSKRQWIDLIKHQDLSLRAKPYFPFTFLPLGHDAEEVDLDSLQSGYREMVRQYDPAKEFILLVHQHPGDLLGCYWIIPTMPPPTAFEKHHARILGG